MLQTTLIALGSVALSGAGQLLLRAGALALAPIELGRLASPGLWLALALEWRILAGVAAWALATLLWVVVLSRAELSLAYGLAALNYVLVPLASSRLYGERLAWPQIAGMALIAAGVALTLASRPRP